MRKAYLIGAVVAAIMLWVGLLIHNPISSPGRNQPVPDEYQQSLDQLGIGDVKSIGGLGGALDGLWKTTPEPDDTSAEVVAGGGGAD